jgi:hypothetical protein
MGDAQAVALVEEPPPLPVVLDALLDSLLVAVVSALLAPPDPELLADVLPSPVTPGSLSSVVHATNPLAPTMAQPRSQCLLKPVKAMLMIASMLLSAEGQRLR